MLIVAVLYRSALATVLSDAKANTEFTTVSSAASELPSMDDSVVMLALAIFILSAPKQVVLASDLQQQCIKVFTRCIRSTMQVCSSVLLTSFQSFSD